MEDVRARQRLVGRCRLVNRRRYLVNLCRGRRVLHLGCTDAPYHVSHAASGRLLHPILLEVAAEVVGVDIDGEALNWMTTRWPAEYHLGDLEAADFMSRFRNRPFDVILLADVLEHLGNPLTALRNLDGIGSPTTDVVITVPNAYSAKLLARVILGYEVVHPDHVSFYSFSVLAGLCGRARLEVLQPFTFFGGGRGSLAHLANAGLRFLPALADGIGVRCRKLT